jgi:flagellar motor switch protein FliN/FliY
MRGENAMIENDAVVVQSGTSAFDAQGSSMPATADAGAGSKPSAARRVTMPDLRSGESAEAAEAATGNLDVILDIPVTLTMEIGRAKIPIRNLLKLNQGSVVELERLAGEPLDVLVNGMLIAHGEVVVVNEHFGIRFTDVVSPAERVQKLR